MSFRTTAGSQSSSTDSAGSHSSALTVEESATFRICKKRQWRKLRRLLSKRNKQEICSEVDSSGLTLLGIAIGYQAPPEIIELIVTIKPSLVFQVDNFNANCLHLACLNGISIDSIKFLLLNGGSDLINQSFDSDNRTPLHHSVECICRGEIAYKEGLQIIVEICNKEGCLMIHHEDRNGDTPIDMVILKINESSRYEQSQRFEHLLKYLRNISIGVYKSLKAAWEISGYCTTGHCIRIIPLNVKSTKSKSTQSTSSLSVKPMEWSMNEETYAWDYFHLFHSRPKIDGFIWDTPTIWMWAKYQHKVHDRQQTIFLTFNNIHCRILQWSESILSQTYSGQFLF